MNESRESYIIRRGEQLLAVYVICVVLGLFAMAIRGVFRMIVKALK